MISYAGVNLEPCSRSLAEWIAVNVRLDDLTPFLFQAWPGPRLDGIAFPAPLPTQRVEIGRLHWPRGAARCAAAWYVCSADELAQIRQAVFSGGYTAQMLILDDGQRFISTSMWMLPAWPLQYADGNQDFFLLTLVDDRWWWWWKAAEVSVTGGSTTWADLFSQLADGLGITLTADDVDSRYLYPSTLLGTSYDSLPLLLDAACYSTGLRLVRKLDGTLLLRNALNSYADMAANLENVSNGQVSGGALDITTDSSLGTTDDLDALLPASVTVIYPASSASSNNEPAQPYVVTLQSLALPDLPAAGSAGNTRLIHSSALASLSEGGVSNDSELSDLATVIATDYYRYSAAPLAICLSGIASWSPEGLHDVIWEHSAERILTRIQRGPWDARINDLNHYGSKGEGDPCCCQVGGVNLQTATYTLQDFDYTKLVSFSSSSAITGNLPDPQTLGKLWFCSIENRGSGTLTLQCPTSSPPAAPTLDNSGTGGSLTAGTYQVEITYVNANGETTASSSTSIAISSAETLEIDSPAATTGNGAATGWYAYVTVAGGSTYYRQQTAGSPTAIGTPLTLTANPTTSGANPPGSNSAGLCTIDGAASLAIATNQGCQLFTDALNYYTMRGMSTAGGGSSLTVQTINPNGSPVTVTSVTTLDIDEASGNNGLTLSGTTGTATVGLTAASISTAGAVTTGAQQLQGEKTFLRDVTIAAASDSTPLTVTGGSTGQTVTLQFQSSWSGSPSLVAEYAVVLSNNANTDTAQYQLKTNHFTGIASFNLQGPTGNTCYSLNNALGISGTSKEGDVFQGGICTQLGSGSTSGTGGFGSTGGTSVAQGTAIQIVYTQLTGSPPTVIDLMTMPSHSIVTRVWAMVTTQFNNGVTLSGSVHDDAGFSYGSTPSLTSPAGTTPSLLFNGSNGYESWVGTNKLQLTVTGGSYSGMTQGAMTIWIEYHQVP